MATVGEDDVNLLRKKLGRASKSKKLVTESRVEAKGGAVIRRRKRAGARTGCPRLPEPVEVAPPIVEPEPACLEGVRRGSTLPEPAVEEPPAEPAPIWRFPKPIAAKPARNRQNGRHPAPSSVAREKERSAEAPDAKSGRQRKLVREVVNLKEQEQLARQAVRTYAGAATDSDRPADRHLSSPKASRCGGTQEAGDYGAQGGHPRRSHRKDGVGG